MRRCAGLGLVALVALVALVFVFVFVTLPWGFHQRIIVPLNWLAGLIWRHRSQPLWLLSAVIAVSLWLAVFVAIWRVDWFDDMAFVIVSHMILHALYQYRGVIAAKLGRLSDQARG